MLDHLILLCHALLVAAGTSREKPGKSRCQADAHCGDGGLNVTLRPDRKRPGDDSRSEGEVPRGATFLGRRGESGLAPRPGNHKLRCTALRDGGTLASPGLRSAPTRSPASDPDNPAQCA